MCEVERLPVNSSPWTTPMRAAALSWAIPTAPPAPSSPVEAGWLTDVDGRARLVQGRRTGYNTSDGNDLYYDVNREPRGLTMPAALRPQRPVRRLRELPAAGHRSDAGRGAARRCS